MRRYFSEIATSARVIICWSSATRFARSSGRNGRSSATNCASVSSIRSISGSTSREVVSTSPSWRSISASSSFCEAIWAESCFAYSS